jgi:hypothetical protein
MPSMGGSSGAFGSSKRRHVLSVALEVASSVHSWVHGGMTAEPG